MFLTPVTLCPLRAAAMGPVLIWGALLKVSRHLDFHRLQYFDVQLQSLLAKAKAKAPTAWLRASKAQTKDMPMRSLTQVQRDYMMKQRATMTAPHTFTWGGRFRWQGPIHATGLQHQVCAASTKSREASRFHMLCPPHLLCRSFALCKQITA